jgi:hypothetical protein
MAYSRDFLTPGSLWRHGKGGMYVVLGISTCSTNGERDGKEEVVVYWSFKYESLRHRDVTEFLDGRFQPFAHQWNPGETPAENELGDCLPQRLAT